jgi:hypothetical protein
MTIYGGPAIETDGLSFYLDPAHSKTYNLDEVEVLIVAGGGGGGMDMGGGGGGGGVIYNSSYSVTPGSDITVTVGAGGYGAPRGGGGYRTDGAGPQNNAHQFNISATSGGNSVFGSLTAIGGGYGGSSYWGYTPNYGYGATGGSGGGASGYRGGIGTVGTRGAAGTSGQGFAGGGGSTYYAGGGGGAGGVGATGPSKANGGPGVRYPSMSPYYFGGGGGGSPYSSSVGGDGGIGGGGGGAIGTTYGGAGLNNGSPGGGGGPNQWAQRAGGNAGANTGGGGGGGSHYNRTNQGGEGGSGIVIVRYFGPQKAIGGTVSSVDGYTLHTFTTVGSNTFKPLSLSDNSPIDGLTGMSANSLFAQANNSPQFLRANKGVIVFDGVNTYLSVNSIPGNFSNFTIIAWFYPKSITNHENVLDCNYNVYPATGNVGPRLEINSSKQLIWIISGNTTNASIYDAAYSRDTNELVANQWCCAALVKNGSTLKAYFNGQLNGTASNPDGFVNSFGNLVIGKGFHLGGAERVFTGNVASVKTYRKAFTDKQILRNFNALKGRYGL